MSSLRTLLLGVFASGMVGIATAQASVIQASLDSSVAHPSLSSWGTVTVTDYVGYVGVDVQLAPGFKFVNTGGQHQEFALNLNTTIAASQVTNISLPGLAPSVGTFTATPYGDFDVALKCPTCGNGGSGALSGPLDFKVMGVTTANFIKTAVGYWFAADIFNTATGLTGTVSSSSATFTATSATGSTGGTTTGGSTGAPVPEPASALLLLSTLGIAAAWRAHAGRGSNHKA